MDERPTAQGPEDPAPRGQGRRRRAPRTSRRWRASRRRKHKAQQFDQEAKALKVTLTPYELSELRRARSGV